MSRAVSIRCSNCGLVNFGHALECRRCNGSLSLSALLYAQADHPNIIEDDKEVVRWILPSIIVFCSAGAGISLSYFASGEKLENPISEKTFLETTFLIQIGISLAILVGMLITAMRAAIEPAPSLDDRGKAIGGWLIVLAIRLSLVPCLLTYQLAELGRALIDMNRIPTDNPITVSLQRLLYFETGACLISLGLTIIIIYRFFNYQSIVPRLVIALFLLVVFLNLLDLYFGNMVFDQIMFWVSGPGERSVESAMRSLRESPVREQIGIARNHFTDVGAKQLIVNLVSALTWIPYFLLSKRVKRTFARGLSRAERFGVREVG